MKDINQISLTSVVGMTLHLRLLKSSMMEVAVDVKHVICGELFLNGESHSSIALFWVRLGSLSQPP